MPKIEQNGPDFKYIVTYQRLDQDDATEITAIIQNPEAWHYVVPDRNLGVYRPFRITVKANNARGDSTANSVTVVGFSGEDGMLRLDLFLRRCVKLGYRGHSATAAAAVFLEAGHLSFRKILCNKADVHHTYIP